MPRYFYYLLVILSVFNKVSAQVKPNDLFKEFALSKKETSPQSPYIFIYVQDNATIEFKNFLALKAVRKFSDNVYVIEKKNLDPFPAEKFLYQLYFAANNNWKLSPVAEFLKDSKAKHSTRYRFTIAVNDVKFIPAFLKVHPEFERNVKLFPSQHLVSVLLSFREIKQFFLDMDEVSLIDVQLKSPKEELATKGFDFSANKLNTVHGSYPLINGRDQHVSVKENYYDTTDIDLKGRYEYSPLASAVVTNHANFIATIIAGADNSNYGAKGVAWGAMVSSSSFEQVLPDPVSYYNQYHITVQNHSYGTDIDNTYGLNAEAFDKSANQNPDLLHVFSSGNSGTSTATAGRYAGVVGFANLTGNFKMAKNVILVGAVDSFETPEPLSSRGPAYDGRLKPELVAFQKNGTSEAAALVSGTTLLLQQYYKSRNASALPSALAKAILINTADDINSPGPDYRTGYGNLNAIKAMDLVKNNTIFTGTVAHGGLQTLPLTVPANVSKLKVTLTWNDTAATGFSSKALVNDLDLELVLPATNASWKPWVLSSFPNADSLNALPKRKRDSLNNAEQITLDNPSQGNYQLNVTGFNLPSGPQKYFVVYTMDTANYFRWYHPVKGDFLQAMKAGILRWDNNFPLTGNIEYSYVPSNTWKPLSSNVDLTKKYFEWAVPDTIANVVFRMKIGAGFFYSDTFLISKLLNPRVGYICADSLFISWEKLPNINKYQLYVLGTNYMEPFTQVTDTGIVIARNSLLNNYIAVSAVINNNQVTPKSYALDYTQQGAGCYINSFLANANNNAAKLSLLLGTIYQVDSIAFERLTVTGFVTIYTAAITSNLNYNFTYQPLSTGVNYFRARIKLSGGRTIYSDKAAVFFVPADQYLFFPNPVKRNGDIEILSAIPAGEMILFTDAVGRVVLQKEIQSAHEIIKTAALQPGIYFYRVIKNGSVFTSGKIVVM